MAAEGGTKHVSRGRRKVVDTLPLRERLLAKGAYKEATNDKLRPNSAASHLFSPHKPSTKVSKEKDTSQVGKKSSKAVMQSYFRRKSNDSSRSSVSHTKASSKEDSFAFMLDAAEMAAVKERSEAFLARLKEQDTDCSDVMVIDTSSLDQLAQDRNATTEDNITSIPLVYNSRGVAYSMMRLRPKSQFGPLVNTGGVMVIIFIDVPIGKVFYESLNLTGKRRLPCPRQAHVLILPDDVFKIYNESDTTDTCVLMLSCGKDGKDFNIEQHVQGAHQTPVR